MKSELEETKEEPEQAPNELSAWKFTPVRQTNHTPQSRLPWQSHCKKTLVGQPRTHFHTKTQTFWAKKPHSYTIQLVKVNIKLTRWTLYFSSFLFPLPLLQRPDGVGLFWRSGHLRKIPLLEHVDTWEMFLFEENRGRNRSLKSVAHCVFRQFGGMKT